MIRRSILILILVLIVPAPAAIAADADSAELERVFRDTVRPFVDTYCISCHNPDKPKGDFDLSAYTSMDTAARDYRRWDVVVERLQANEMPPEKAKKHPMPVMNRPVIEWVQAMRKYEAHRNAGDPGPVFARRLSNAEYDYTIRDLTGADIRPAKEFPVDPANEAGFDNSSESLTMTPSLVKKYMEAAQRVSNHLVLEPTGITFAPHPVIAETDRDKFCVNQIIHFYKKQKTDYADYFEAAWRYQHRTALGKPQATLSDIAADAGISSKYLTTIWGLLSGPKEDVGPIAALQAIWRDLPADPAAAHGDCVRMRDFVIDLRAKLVPTVPNLTSPDVERGSQTLVLWKDRQMAANRMRYSGGALNVAPTQLLKGSAAAKAMAIPTDPAAASHYELTFNRFCSTFPDTFFVSERARVFLDPKGEKDLTGRFLSAGLHNQMGYFRDDAPLYKLMLNESDQRELDRLWQTFEYFASIPARQYSGFLWFERSESNFMRADEFDFARAEDKAAGSEAMIKRLAKVYITKAIKHGAGKVAVQAMEDYFAEMSARIRIVEREQSAAETSQLQALTGFAELAYRRPLTVAERQEIIAFYHTLRAQDGLTHDEAMRDSVVSILMSPHFCYRLDLPRKGDGPARPLDDYALASRLSYFLWASMPDRPLLDLAAAGKLHQPEILAAQAKRMLRDDKARGFAVEFTGNWLDFRRFEEHNGVDRGRFPSFDNDLREAMFEEPVLFFLDVARRDASVLDFLYGDYTFVNSTLAHHYGIPSSSGEPGAWTRVDNAGQFNRGGILPMAVFLTKNSPGLRTSPVKRGNWVVKRILGERIPVPPAKVPELPSDESKLGELTLRETLARHRADPSCAACHERFDSMGLVFEGYGPIGETRQADLGGRPVDTRATFPGGLDGSGLAGLRTYIHQKRETDFIDNLCRQMLAYGLGRTLQLSDDETIAAMRTKLAADGFRFDTIVEAIVTSPQFMNKRANTEVTKE